MKKKILLTVFALIACGVLYVAFCWLPSVIWPQYVAVYMTTGDMYFGKVISFPRYGLQNAWFMQRDESGRATLSQFSKVLWEPKGDVYLNKRQIVLIAPLKEGTQVYTSVVQGGVFVQAGDETADQLQPQQPAVSPLLEQ